MTRIKTLLFKTHKCVYVIKFVSVVLVQLRIKLTKCETFVYTGGAQRFCPRDPLRKSL